MIGRALGALTASVLGVCWLNDQLVQVCGEAIRYPQNQVSPQSYRASTKSKYEVDESGGNYAVKYAFSGPESVSLQWNWTMQKSAVDGIWNSYGIPMTMFNAYSPTPDVIASREKLMKSGGFKQDSSVIRPNYSEIMKANRNMVAPIVELANKLQPNPTLADRVSMWLTFCQDMPYGIPPSQIDGKFIGGMLPPASVLAVGWGDCDSKSTLFGTLLSFHPNVKMVFVSVPGHQLVGVRAQAISGQDSIQFEGEEYVLCEPVGLARLPMGKKSSLVTTIVSTRRVLPFE